MFRLSLIRSVSTRASPASLVRTLHLSRPTLSTASPLGDQPASATQQGHPSKGTKAKDDTATGPSEDKVEKSKATDQVEAEQARPEAQLNDVHYGDSKPMEGSETSGSKAAKDKTAASKQGSK